MEKLFYKYKIANLPDDPLTKKISKCFINNWFFEFYNFFDSNASPADSQDESQDESHADGSNDDTHNKPHHCRSWDYPTGKLWPMHVHVNM